MLDAVDTYYEYVAGRMATLYPTRKMVGVADAMDWPPKNIVFEAFYLLVLGQKSIGKSFWSPSITTLSHQVQWTWLIIGTDLTQGKVGRSRGDRYRTNMTMREELLTASYPWFTVKEKFSVLGNTPSGLAVEGTPLVPTEDIWWGQPTFLNRVDRTSGVVYGAASVQVVSMGPLVTS